MRYLEALYVLEEFVDHAVGVFFAESAFDLAGEGGEVLVVVGALFSGVDGFLEVGE